MKTTPVDNQNYRYIELQGIRANTESSYPSNVITTSSYTHLNFFPKNLFFQFLNPSKLWFLLVSLLEVFNQSDITYQYGTIIPLCLLILLQIARDAFNEYHKMVSDSKINSKFYAVWNGNAFMPKLCKDILVGDLVLLTNNEQAPADILLLSVGNEEHQCYVDSSEILGESNLKIKSPVKEIQNILDSIDLNKASVTLGLLNDDLFVSLPHKAFKFFHGKVRLSISPRASELEIRNLVFRDMKIVNTAWVIGIVVYAGMDTKIWINNLIRPKKFSQLGRIMEKWLLWAFLFIFLISVINTIVFAVVPVEKYHWYDVFLGNLLLLNHMIPISLALSFEFVRIFLNYLVQKKEPNVKLNSSDLCSNLGMVEYIITDKTGTLTEKNLRMPLCVVGNKIYIENYDPLHSSISERIASDRYFYQEQPPFAGYEGEIFNFKDLQENLMYEQGDASFLHFFYCLALCNLSFPEDDKFIAISHDDIVFANFAAEFGFKVVARDEETCLIEVFGNDLMFYVIGTQAYASDSKKSRIVVKQKGSNDVFMYLKGPKSAMTDIFKEEIHTDEIDSAIVHYRTLYLGYKKLRKREISEFINEYNNARLSLVNKEGRVESVFEKFEKNVSFLGIVGLEDPISDATKHSIQTLKKAGIKFWLLSGDSEESTTTSALSSGIFTSENKILRLADLASELDCLNYLEKYTKENIFPSFSPRKGTFEGNFPVQAVKSQIELSPMLSNEDLFPKLSHRKVTVTAKRSTKRRSSVHPFISKLSLYKHLTSMESEYNPKDMNFVLSIDSKGLEYCLETAIHLKYFIFLLFTAKAVCFHSLLPDQKSKIVRLVKFNFRFNPLVLSVGDSISDLGMIQQAHIGVGIKGSSAANNADFTITKFSDLTNLLLIHGHKQYIQISKMVLLSFYAMAVLELQLLFYNIVAGFTASSVISSQFLLIYKLVLCIIPISGLCLLDKDNSSTYITPQAYKAGIFNSLLTVKKLSLYIFTAILQSINTFVLSLLYFGSILNSGRTESLLLINISVFIIISATVFFSIIIETYSLSIKTLFIYVITCGIQVLIIVPLSYYDLDLIGYGKMLLESQAVWVLIIPTTVINITISYLFKAFRFNFYPGILEKVRGESPNSSLQSETRLKQYSKAIHTVFRESAEWVAKKNLNSSKLNLYLLRFSSKFLEKYYQSDKIMENIKSYRVLLLLSGVSILSFSLYEVFRNLQNTAEIVYLCISALILLLAPFITSLSSFCEFALVYIVVYYILVEIFLLVIQVVFNHYSLCMVVYLPIIGMIGFSNYWFYMTITVFLSTVLVVLNSFFYFYSETQSLESVIIATISHTIIYLTLCSITSIVSYHIDKSKRLEFLLVQQVQIEIQKTKSVLNYLLPAFVRKRVKEGIRFISENQGIVTIIFCDICNFELILRDYNSQELTMLLDEIFGKFDQICILSGCTKIETVGKTYMACAGLKESEAELDTYYSSISHARRCIEMALAIIRSIEFVTLKNGESLQFYIGINSGPVTAGVIGHHKPQFSLVGDTVNTASRMASLCPRPNVIQISTKTYELIGDTVGLIFNQHCVYAKGKGTLNTFLVSSMAPSNDSSALLSKHVSLSLSQSISEMFSYKPNTPRSHSNFKKVTLAKFTNQHADVDRRRSSLISLLESEVTVDNEFLKRETEIIEKVQWFNLSCQETIKEKNFRIEISETTYPIALLSALFRIICNCFLLITLTTDIIITNDFRKIYEMLRLITETLVVGLLAFNLNKYFQKQWFSWLIGLVYIIGGIFKLGDTTSAKDVVFIEFILHMTQAAHCSQLFFKNFIVLGFLCFISYLVFEGILNFSEIYQQVISNCVCFMILLYSVYSRENSLRYYSTITVAAERELKKTELLLTQMLPKHVFEIVKEQNSVTEHIKNVTILYADICGFTQWSSEKSPEQVVNMLSELFTRFDHKCVEHHVYKVHTIGDCYVAMGYIESENRSFSKECLNITNFAIDLVKIIHEVNTEKDIDLNMRIGIHTGDIIGGITGTNIVRYDIYGIDVVIANKMESTGKPGFVKVSEATKKILNEHYQGFFNFNIDEEAVLVIGGKEINSYFLEVGPEYVRQTEDDKISEI